MAPLIMEAVQFDPKALQLKHTKLEAPTGADKNEVILKIAYAGVCGTDVHIIEGRVPCKSTPFVMGHEMSAVVAEVGSNVFHVSVGDHVAVDPNRTCHTCNVCTSGMYNACQISPTRDTIGIMRDGAMAQYCRVPADQVYKLPKEISLRQGVLCEPMSCVAHCWDRLSPVPMGSTILVTGAGIIGNLCVASAYYMGFRDIILSEPSEGRRAISSRLGLGDGVKVVSPDELKAMRASDPSFGVDVAIDASGAVPALEAGFELLKPGGKLIVFGIAAPDVKMRISPYDVYKKELTVLGNTMNPYTFNKSIGFVSGMKDMLAYEKLGIGTFKLSQYKEAMEQLKKGTISKAVFEVSA
ncbi:D-arabitol-phosphate dehydrogenase [Frankliniella fusca]|uniref:D-arabitol-phosphate dehydrogenase n=3 Tax=Arthropoda TaxID=6656 RepID=A0AAE1LWM3_9NEOP|nr:D-arabitol-phosphate dehydrogenase [Frankliniella fusca]